MKVVVFGCGRFASLAWYVLSHDSAHEVVGFTVDAAFLTGSSLHGLPLVAFEEVEQHFPPESVAMIAPLGTAEVNGLRAMKHAAGRARNYRFISYVSSRALTWPDLRIGENCMIFDGAMVQPFAQIGHGVILRSGAQISHHVELGDHCFLAGHAFVGGSAKVGERCFLGAHSVIRDGVSVAARCVIGAGGVVTSDIDREGVYFGIPAKWAKEHRLSRGDGERTGQE